jgi:hypothetical protein
MRIQPVALAVLFLAAASASTPSLAQPADEFAALCMKRGIRESACQCQAKLARAAFNSRERRAAINILKGGEAVARREVAQMGEARAKTFRTKMEALGRRAQAECR